MKSWPKTNARVILWVALGASAGATFGILATLALTVRDSQQSIVELPLHATSTDTGEQYSLATAPFSDEMEGLFVLDFRTGLLTLDVLNVRDGRKPGAHFETNVIKALGVEEGKAKYLMVTAETKFIFPKAGPLEPSRSVVYVMDENTGRWVAYGFRWNPVPARNGVFQNGQLEALVAGGARPAEQQ